MTIVAWDGKIIAADKQASSNGLSRITSKLFPGQIKGKDFILSGVGTDESVRILVDWYHDGADPDKWPECQKDKERWSNLIVINSEGAKLSSLWPKFIKIENPFYAWGSGAELALGAMATGAGAIKAVEIACVFEDGCGMGIDAYDLSTMEKIR